ncbi:MAG: hypothetical protein BWY17_01868 [Deltaproteobacteria bacterium ADurb.Bin207]|nr:MAG: hypothetical protein BWY17_01868 [Deltaproteobacteria bacterium ADurb.Bin207]
MGLALSRFELSTHERLRQPSDSVRAASETASFDKYSPTAFLLVDSLNHIPLLLSQPDSRRSRLRYRSGLRLIIQAHRGHGL